MKGSGDAHERIEQVRERVADLRAAFRGIVGREQAGEVSRSEEIASLQPIIAEMGELTDEMRRRTQERHQDEASEPL